MPCVSKSSFLKQQSHPAFHTLCSWLGRSSAPAGSLTCGGGQDFSISQRPSHPLTQSLLCVEETVAPSAGGGLRVGSVAFRNPRGGVRHRLSAETPLSPRRDGEPQTPTTRGGRSPLILSIGVVRNSPSHVLGKCI